MTDYLRLAQERAPQTPDEQDNPYLPLAQQQQSLQQNRARTVIESALKDDPDLAAERLRLSQTAGLPPDVVQRNFEELRVKERARAVDLVKMAEDSPVLYRQLTDPSFATTSVDDLDTLKNIERSVGKGLAYVMGADGQGGLPRDAVGAAKTVGLGATVGVAKMAYDVAGALNDLIGWQSGAQGARGTSQRLQGVMDEYGFQGGGSTRDAVKSGLQSAGTNLALLPIGLVRGLYSTANQAASTVAGLMSAGVGADAFLRAREQGRTQVQALTYAIPEATFEFVFERIPASKLFGDIANNTGLLRMLGRQTVSEGWTEQVTTLTQDFNEWMNLNPDKTLAEFISERPEAAYQTFIATLVGVGVQTTTIQGINKVIEQASNQSLVFERDLLEQQMQMAAASMLRQRSPEQFRTHMQRVVDANDGAKKEIYVDAEVLNQLPQEVLAQLPESVREALPGALDANSTVAIPMADVLTVAPGTELEQILNDNARMRPNAPSRIEAELTAQLLAQDAQRVLEQAADTAAWQQSSETVKTTILEQLNTAGRFTPDVNDAYATLQANFFSTMAARVGTTPQALYDRYQLRVGARQVGGAPVLNADPATPEFREWFGESKVVDEQGAPLVMYHGTGADFTEFRLSKSGSYGSGIYLTNDPGVASGFAGNGTVMPVYVSLQNPYTLDMDAITDFGERMERRKVFHTAGARERLMEQGYDGVIVREKGYQEVVAFNPNQVKSKFNERPTQDPNILRQDGTDQAFDQTETPGFQAWSNNHPVVPLGEPYTFQSGEGVVVEALHGTTGDFDTFDRNRANIESDLGGGFYATNNPADVGENYAGLGPDLTNKVERLAEQIAKETDREYNDPDVVNEARAQFMTNEGFTMPVFVRFDNPVVIGGEGETFLTYEETYNEETDEYGEPEGTLVDFVEALREATADFSDADADGPMAAVFERVLDSGGIKVSELIDVLKASESFAYATDDNGTLASSEIIRRALEGMGFDGFIDQTVSDKFGPTRRINGVTLDRAGGMKGMDENTVHFIAFNPGQMASRIGSTWDRGDVGDSILKQGPRGTFNPQDLLITLNESADLSTFLHESGHFFLEVLADLASQPNAPAPIQADMAATLKWFGVTGAVERGVPVDMVAAIRSVFPDRVFSPEELQAIGDAVASDRNDGGAARAAKEAVASFADVTPVQMSAVVVAIRSAQTTRTPLEVWNAMTLDQKRQYHERWAESFEQYLFEGKAPSAELQPLFRRFRSWLVNVYKSLTQFMRGRNLKMNDEVRQVFDRLVATDEQIAQAEEAAGMLPDFEATNEAIEQLQARSLRDLKWVVRARGKTLKALKKEAKTLRKEVEAEVRAEVEQQPVYKAMNWLKKGETLDPETGDLVKAEKGFRIAPDALAEMYPETMLGRPDLTRLRGMTGKDGLHPDMVADMFGFKSGDQLVRSIIDAEPISSVIEGMTDQRMLERHGDLATPEAREAAANEAVHNEARARALATELKSQAEMMNQRQDTGRTDVRGRPITVNAVVEAAKQFALNLAARRRLKDLKNAAWQHRAAEARAGKRWQQLTSEGKSEEAVQAKRDQLLNNYAAKALQDAQVEVRKTLEFFKRITKGNDEQVVDRGRDPDVVNAMRAILAAYDVAPRLEKTALAYMETVAKNDPQMYAALKPSVDGALLNAKPLTELTLEELRGLNDELRAMWTLAKRSRQMEVDGNLLDIEDAADELLARMGDIGIPDEIPGERGAITDKQEAGIKLQFAKAILSRVEQWAERLDGSFGGPFLRLVFQPVKDAADRYRTDRVSYRKQFTELLKAVAPALPPGPIAAPELNYTFGNARDSGAAELLHAILHTGNDSNKRKLLLGRGWATQDAEGNLDTGRWDAFIERLQGEGVLRKEHYDFAQGVWDLLEQMKPLAQETHRKVFGRYFAEVTANEFETPFGTYRGGYVPAQTDSRLVKDAKLRELAEGENESMAYAFPAAPSGFTKSRVEYNQPLLLDLRALAQHMDKVLLFSHMQGAVTDVRRLLTNKRVSYALDRIDPGAYEGMLIPWLNRSAKQIVETPVAGDRKISRFLSAARSRAGMALMFANLSNTVQQITGFSMAGVKVKPGLMLNATASFIANPKAMKTAVTEASPFMKDRMLNEVSAMNDAVEDILVNPTALQKGQAWTQRHAYFMQAAVDNTMSPIIWTAAYNQSIEQGMSERDAVRFADGVIRQTQGTTLPEDISRFESGPAYGRLFTQFVSYFNMMANTNATAVSQIVGEMGLRKGAGRLLYVALAGLMVPIWVAEAIAHAFRGGPEDEDGDGWLDDWLMAVFGLGTIRGLVAQVPIVGQAAQLVVNRFNDNPADDKFSLSPAVSLIESTVSAPASVYNAIVEDGSKQKAVRDVAAAATMITGLPIFAVGRPVGYLTGMAEDRIEPTGPVDLARGLVSGTASPESRVR